MIFVKFFMLLKQSRLLSCQDQEATVGCRDHQSDSNNNVSYGSDTENESTDSFDNTEVVEKTN